MRCSSFAFLPAPWTVTLTVFSAAAAVVFVSRVAVIGAVMDVAAFVIGLVALVVVAAVEFVVDGVLVVVVVVGDGALVDAAVNGASVSLLVMVAVVQVVDAAVLGLRELALEQAGPR